MVTHDVPVVREAADVAFILEGGRVVESGPPEKVLGAPEHEATRGNERGPRAFQRKITEPGSSETEARESPSGEKATLST